jgi:hypothetical protein
MKTKIIKIVIILTVAMFMSANISIANEWKGRHPKPNGNAYGHQKWDGHHPGYQKKHHKSYHHEQRPRHHYREEVHEHHHYYKSYPSHSGFFFGMSIYDPNMAVIFGVKGY